METLGFIIAAAFIAAGGWYAGARWGLSKGGLKPEPLKRLLGLD